MPSPTRLLVLASLLLSASAIVPRGDTGSDPATPDGYELVFGPTNGANNAPGYMGFAYLNRYDPGECAVLCNARGYDSVGGVCQYFNIWRAVEKGVPTTYTCSMYYLPANASTAINYGQGDLKVTLSRGYKRLSLAVDGGFEGYNPLGCSDSGYCYDEFYANWIGSFTSGTDLAPSASMFFNAKFAHTGHGSALLGAAYGGSTEVGTLTHAKPLKTHKGQKYVVQAFISSAFSGEEIETEAVVEVLWNGECVGSVGGFQEYKPTQFVVVGTGCDDVLAFRGGKAPAWSFVDDVFVAPL
ncbi:hypothetical protein FB45DRAFT_1008372 [Roridomyces roridus]|uniref:Uncharacterized protein n=1 Tax=Roridomyces roridus TaxID=1738132 RepID=A0AAD7BAU9_9AGAR|nr:hypothetical protein FB45DRAFT_1008372 [Roridomyces roridus]